MLQTIDKEQEHVLRETFWSPYEQVKMHIGKKFKVLRTLNVDEIGDVDLEGELFEIQLEDGTIINAWYEEIYEKSCYVNNELI